jgi:hypothetical protein
MRFEQICARMDRQTLRERDLDLLKQMAGELAEGRS